MSEAATSARAAAKSFPWKRAVAAAATAILLFIVVALFAVAWYMSGILEKDGLRPDPSEAPLDMVVTAIDEGQVTLSVTEESSEEGPWTRAGLWGLKRDGAYDQVGDIIEINAERVVREYFPIDGDLTVGEKGRVDAAAFPSDPAKAFGLPFDEVSYSSPHGSFPVWLVDGPGDTWAIFVHGRTANRKEALRVLKTTAELGLPSMVITYQNDEGVAASPSGYYEFGQTEWEDLEGAVKYALEHEADGVILVGYSMGGAIVTSFLLESPTAIAVSGVILDAPMINFNATVELGAREKGLPTALLALAKYVASLRFGVDWGKLDYLSRADELAVPILLFHGDEDDTVPIRTSEALAEARPDIVEYIRTSGAPHVGSWNMNRAVYEAAVSDFIRRVAPRPAETTGIAAP